MTKVYLLGPFRLDADTETLLKRTDPMPLGRRAVALLRALVERQGTLVSKDELIEAAWSGLHVEEANLTVQIAAVRKVLSEHPMAGRWIETLPCRGYRYVGPIATEEIGSPPHRVEALFALPFPDRPSIAVLPFQNISGDVNQEYFADGMVDEIITGLARITNPPRKYSTNRANQSMPYAWRPGGIFADLILLRKQSCVVLP